MERILKTFFVLLLVSFLAITVGSVAEYGVYAGGGTDYKVTVANNTNVICRVWLYVHDSDVGRRQLPDVTMGSNVTHTFSTGDDCPLGLKGQAKVYESGEQAYFFIDFYSTIHGEPVSSTTSFSEKSCSDASFSIVHEGSNEFKGYKFQKN